jgi:hypothetical protein
MNLVQIQERLKDMPTQALMAYANGMNPEVPPYLALTELNRRKNMEQPSAQMPQGTVKEQIEGELSAAEMKKQGMQQMQMDAMRQQQMMQQMMQQMPQQAPQGMAYGGIARVPVSDRVMQYGNGGIVAFANGELVEDVYGEKSREEEERDRREREEELASRIPGQNVRAPERTEERMPGEVERNILNMLSALPGASAVRAATTGARMIGPGIAALLGRDKVQAEQPMPQAEQPRRQVEQAAPRPAAPQAEPEQRVPRRMPEPGVNMNDPAWQKFIADVMGSPNISEEQKRMVIADAMQKGGAAPTARFEPMGQPPARPQAGVPAAAQAMVQPAPQPQVGVPAAAVVQTSGPDYRKMLAEQAGKQVDRSRLAQLEQSPYAQKQPGEVLEQYIKRMEERSTQEDQRFAEMEKERARAALWKGLMAAGEASRGQRGIGALLGGFGRTVGEEMEAGRGREEAQMKARREREDAIVKMRQEIENARIARARGDVETERKSLQDAEKYRRDAIEKGVEIQAQDERAAANRQEQARRDQTLAPDARMYIEDWLRKNPGKSFSDAYAAFKAAGMPAQAARGQMTWDQALDNARQEFKDQNPLVWEAMEKKKAQQEGRAPVTYQQAIMNRAKELMQGATGAPAQASGPREGDTAKSNSGKPIIFRNGRWEYQ